MICFVLLGRMTRQRPQLVFEADGFTPKLLVQGGSFAEYNQGTTALERTYVFEFHGVRAAHRLHRYLF